MTEHKRSQPVHSNVPDASFMCLKHAQEQLNRGAERIAEYPGVSTRQFTLYKWISSGKIPACKILPFERACGADYITRYLVHGHNKLIVPIPSGRRASNKEITELSLSVHSSLSAIHQFYEGNLHAEEAMTVITELMEDLAHHRNNIAKYKQPELGLEH